MNTNINKWCHSHYKINVICLSFTVVVKPPYEVTETGWGEFEVIIKIFFNDPNEKPVSWLLNDFSQTIWYGLVIFTIDF